jgi:hypothetical protein
MGFGLQSAPGIRAIFAIPIIATTSKADVFIRNYAHNLARMLRSWG